MAKILDRTALSTCTCSTELAYVKISSTVVKVMDKFLNRSREAELEPNQNNAFSEKVSSASSDQKKAKTVM